MGWHWRVSVALNCLLLGRPGEPFCSRAYRNDWRMFMRCMDWLFSEPEHCRNIHRRWMRK